MIKDEELKSSVDYSEGQKRAAHRVLVELVNIFQEYEDEIRVVGGWVPDLMFPEEGHVGSVDVDIMVNHLTLDNGLTAVNCCQAASIIIEDLNLQKKFHTV